MENIKLIKKITIWKPIGIRTNDRPKISWRNEVIHDLRKLKLRNCLQLVKEFKIWNDLVQKNKTHVGLWYDDDDDDINDDININNNNNNNNRVYSKNKL
jgi:hypothetical protein